MIAEETMISVKFSHNPYLRETKVSFNGKAPRVNSAVEKHLDSQLCNWVSETPRILHDEMNGYDFTVEFSGTTADLDSLKQAFEEAGAGEDEVRFVHKTPLRDARSKKADVEKLLNWLRTVGNRQFAFSEMLKDHPDLFEASFPLIVVHGHETDAPEILSVEEIESVTDLENTDLTHTPIIYHVTPESWSQLKQDIRWLLSKDTVLAKQLFFVIHPSLSSKRVLRALNDLGITKPCIVRTASDPAVNRYLDNYPITDYIHSAITVAESYADSIKERLEKERESVRLTGDEKGVMIRALEEEIAKLREVEDRLSHMGQLEQPYGFALAKQDLEKALLTWKSRKTKVVGESEIVDWASVHGKAARVAFAEYLQNIEFVTKDAKRKVDARLASTYEKAGVDTLFRASCSLPAPDPKIDLPDFEKEALGIVTVTYEDPRADIFKIFNNSEVDENGKVKVVYCFLDQWRARSAELTIPIADAMIESRTKALSEYLDAQTRAYAEHVEELLSIKRGAKDALVERLSDDERALQEDTDWLNELNGQLQEIERG